MDAGCGVLHRCAIIVADTVAASAAMGVQSITWWPISMVLFFVPYGLVSAELGSAWAEEGGIYVWVREAMGPFWGTMTSWLYWINVAYWMPSVFVLFAGILQPVFWPGLAMWGQAVVALGYRVQLHGIRVDELGLGRDGQPPTGRAQSHLPGGLFIAIAYILSTFGILAAVPVDKVNIVAGITDALQVMINEVLPDYAYYVMGVVGSILVIGNYVGSQNVQNIFWRCCTWCRELRGGSHRPGGSGFRAGR